jgi:hypothetical protein
VPAGIRPGTPVIDTRRYQFMIGAFGLLLVVIFSLFLYFHNGPTQPGIAPGRPLPKFVAPLARSNLDASANPHPRCLPGRAARRGVNVCGRQPTVLALFALGEGPCIAEVNAMQRITPRFPGVAFVAVAVNAGHRATAQLVRRRGWTIPVAYDATGIIGELYGMTGCPIVEVAGAGGRVRARLIGEYWARPRALARALRRLGFD